jgi:hypothetical protein
LSNERKIYYYLLVAGIAQLVEQWIENPRVSSSNLLPGNFHSVNYIIKFPKEALFESKDKCIVPTGPFRCFAIITSATLVMVFIGL